MSYTKDEIIVARNVEDEMKESYMRYSMSVIISRALPDVRDGLADTPQRRLAMVAAIHFAAKDRVRPRAVLTTVHWPSPKRSLQRAAVSAWLKD